MSDIACLGPRDKFHTEQGHRQDWSVGFSRLRALSLEMLTLLSVFPWDPVFFGLLLLPGRRGHLLQLTEGSLKTKASWWRHSFNLTALWDAPHKTRSDITKDILTYVRQYCDDHFTYISFIPTYVTRKKDFSETTLYRYDMHWKNFKGLEKFTGLSQNY